MENELLPCPFCGGEAHIEKYCDMCSTEIDFKCARDKSPDAICAIGEEVFWVEHKCELLSNDEELYVGCFTSAREAIAAWNTRADYHGYEQAAIEAWESIKAWNSRAERTCENKNKSVTSFWCSKCDAATSDGFADVGGKLARFNYCPNCGRK